LLAQWELSLENISTSSSTVDQLRSDIDRGRTGDKVDAPDPAAAPLGTDEEAAGTPIPANAVATAREAERGAARHTRANRAGLGAAWVLVWFVVLLAVGILGWILWR
jgi:hypothetical protein